jgi:hypothetical protein
VPDPEPIPPNQAEFDAMVRRYLARVAVRYAPVAAALVVLALIIALVPTTQPLTSTTGLAAPGVSAGTASGTQANNGTGVTATAGGATAGGATAGPNGAPGVDSSTAGGQTGQASGAPGAGPGGAGGGPTATPTGGSTTGANKLGIQCGPGVRQFTWSSHSPLCVPAFTGNNGGATAPGVTGSTITLTYRVPASAEDSTIAALSGSANVSEPAMVADFKSYINFFNTQFELYGRKVVLKAFNGQGDYIDEDQGQNLAGAQADAVTAKDMGAFGDVTFSLGASEAYEQDLAAEHVISFSSVAEPQRWFEAHAPYEYSVQGSSGTNSVTASSAVLCRRLAGMPATFSGDASATKTTRVFGIIYPENPNYASLVDQYKQTTLAACGLTYAKVIAYAINVSQYTSEAVSIIAQMKAAHVTTILCACDPIFPILLTPAASSQSYYPEWFGADFGDPVSQDYTQSEWSHQVAAGAPSGPSTQTEAYKAFKLGFPKAEPAEEPPTSPPYFYVPYYTLLQVFEALQAAGPDLTPQTFEQGMFSLPPSNVEPQGGQWVFGQNVFDPVSSFGLVWWNPKATSPFDNKPGTYQACNGGQIYTLANLAALGGPHQQLNCFGH